jgi:adenylate cyclase
MTATRRLAAILAADVAGYSRLIGADEGGTLQALKAIRAELIDPTIAAHNGRLVKTTGDGLLVEFGSVVDALQCATEVQAGMVRRNTTAPADKRIEFRIGINMGDIVVEDGDIFGDGVNVAARLETLASPGGICVSARVQEDAAGKLDLSFEDLGEQALKNIARPVKAYRIAPGAVSATAQETPALALPDKPSIAVLPFANLSGDPEQEYFADGMVEEIITALSRIRWLFVIARNSSFTYKDQAIDVKRVGRELGVRYVLEGSVRKVGGRVRITAQLIDATSGTHLWADRFDGLLEDVFDLQDKVASSVAGVIEPALQAAETTRTTNSTTSDLTAYDLYLRAYAMLWSSTSQSAAALRLLQQAISRDPRYGPALAWAAFCCFRLLADGRSEDRAADRLKGVDFARRALEVAGDDASILANAAYVLAAFGENIIAMTALVDRALSLNPNYARGWEVSGGIRNWAGHPEIAIEHIEIALRLSPRVRIGNSFFQLGQAHFLARRFEDAAPKLLVAIEEDPTFPQPYRFLAACYAHMGQLDDAQGIVARLRTITSLVIPDTFNLRSAEHRELFLSGLRLAAGEET